jgi:hypothetical protein
MASQRPLAVEAAARRDLRKLRDYSNSGLARAYLLMARMLDEGMAERDAAAVAREMRLAFLTLQQLSPSRQENDDTDDLRARREARMTRIANQAQDGGT